MSVISCTESGWDTQDDRWDDWEGEEMDMPMKCLFCAQMFQGTSDLFQHAKEAHRFDFLQARADLKLDFYQCMRVINYIRTQGLRDPGFGSASGFSIDGTEAFLSDDAYLAPAIPDDSLLYALDDLDLDDPDLAGTASATGSHADGSAPAETQRERELAARIKALEQQLERREHDSKLMAEQFEGYKLMVRRQFFDGVEASAPAAAGSAGSAPAEDSDYYFNSYAGNDIHMQMLQDKVRTEGYRDFMYDNKDVFKGKVVLDVGCGTGILSMFAARAGAAKVIAVDNSDIINKARANVIENGLEGTITLLKGRIEELELPVARVDIIISEWMGYFLLFEAMLDSVLVARDRYLAPGGLLAPSASYIYLTAISDDEYMSSQANYWNDVYGFKMSAMKAAAGTDQADVDIVPSASVVATRALIAAIDHGSATPAALDFSSPFVLKITQDSAVHALLGYFDVAFSRSQATPGPTREELGQDAYASGEAATPTATKRALWTQPPSPMGGFTTGPHGTPTHWKQTIFVLRDPIQAKAGDEVHGQFTCKKSPENPRELVLEIAYTHVSAATRADPALQKPTVQNFQLR
ncbi:hypothetical protein GGF46_002293 [Coemansia sp. RSA 552]|nr:hypothetical protein GGF46_002293 [Coemansia sp. RSA 552]